MTMRNRYLVSCFICCFLAIFLAYFEWWSANGTDGICTYRYPFPRGKCIHSILLGDPHFFKAFIKRILLMCSVPVAGATFSMAMFILETRKERSKKHEK